MDPTMIDAIIAGPSVGLAILLWVFVSDRKRHKEERESLLADLREERNRNNQLGQDWMQLATETKIHIEANPKALEGLGGVVRSEHETTRTLITNEQS